MERRPEDRDCVGFILESGGIGKAALRILARDRLRAIANPSFWGLVIHSLLICVYGTVFWIGIPLSFVYLAYLAFSPDASDKQRSGALISIIIAAGVIALERFASWRDRPRK